MDTDVTELTGAEADTRIKAAVVRSSTNSRPAAGSAKLIPLKSRQALKALAPLQAINWASPLTAFHDRAAAISALFAHPDQWGLYSTRSIYEVSDYRCRGCCRIVRRPDVRFGGHHGSPGRSPGCRCPRYKSATAMAPAADKSATKPATRRSTQQQEAEDGRCCLDPSSTSK